MKRKFAISDIHGELDLLITLLNAADFNPSMDQLVFVGDLIDRGPDSVGVIKCVKKLKEQNPENIFVILGNHEIMMRQYIFGGKSHMWLRYGGLKVIEEMKTKFEGITDRNNHLVWLANLPLTHVDEKYLYVHAGIDLSRDINKQEEASTFIPLKELYSIDPNVLNKTVGNRIIVHGHTPYPLVYRAGNFISCDTGASVYPNGKLSLVDLTNQIYYCCETDSTRVLELSIQALDIKERINKQPHK
ncbi:metallophosphoesterase family protein [Paenibacillus sp. BSR1-1]|uniref:metallophosphoesterase family protein n=1 Tax=Paenibacillus sp. BSR1-1 TaxID=3020845 RepID=UPI0025AFC254|nr:metallophosphoesterase family protein [Paenibacillus sp. BSR1-1]MDN3016853.1 metallophosphoesterase family protein [Paenibacillus sp. BSR1-1]